MMTEYKKTISCIYFLWMCILSIASIVISVFSQYMATSSTRLLAVVLILAGVIFAAANIIRLIYEICRKEQDNTNGRNVRLPISTIIYLLSMYPAIITTALLYRLTTSSEEAKLLTTSGCIVLFAISVTMFLFKHSADTAAIEAKFTERIDSICDLLEKQSDGLTTIVVKTDELHDYFISRLKVASEWNITTGEEVLYEILDYIGENNLPHWRQIIAEREPFVIDDLKFIKHREICQATLTTALSQRTKKTILITDNTDDYEPSLKELISSSDIIEICNNY